MTNKELAQKLLDLLGGKDNVLANAACMTRLRVTVKDTGNVDTEGIKALDGVMAWSRTTRCRSCWVRAR